MTLDKELIENAKDGNLDEVRSLIQRGANVNAKDGDGDTALIDASWKGKLDLVRTLLMHDGVDVNIKNRFGNTALILASMLGRSEVVRALLNHYGVNVNIKDNGGFTALIGASYYGHLEEVRALLNHNGVDVNIKNNRGKTALIEASEFGRLDVVRALLNHDGVDVNIKSMGGDTALDVARKKNNDDVARLLQEHMEREKLRKEKERNPHKKSDAEMLALEEKRPSSTDVALEKDLKLLLHVMNTPSADPAELSLEYIEQCIKKDHKLGSGAYGDVFLAEDSRLPKKFAVKIIRTKTHCNEAAIKEMRKSFQRELSTLKTFRHPNIIVLYGYSLNANSTQQCLVYEHATNGCLADFFTDDGNRARLSADTRLSIMFKFVRAVHFLHTGGCKVAGKGWNVFHRDIKSANICLADDFTPRLIDCGLAKFVLDDESSAITGSSTVTLQSTIGGFALGTPGYMCPVYVKKKGNGHPCPYIAEYDVYSIGVVLVELILGCLNGVRSTRNDSLFLDVFEKYVQGERSYHRIVDGWKKLKRDADPTIVWNADALEIACKTAIQCMDPFPEERLSTKDLLDTLSDAILLHNNTGIQHPDAARAVKSGPRCDICNSNCTDVKCSEGHALCTLCIVDKLGDYNGCQLMCLIKECSSKLQDTDLYGRISIEMYNRRTVTLPKKWIRDKVLQKYSVVFICASTAVVAHCEAPIENDTMSTIEASGPMQAMAGDAFKFIAEKARANTNAKARTVPVCRHNETPIWVKSTYEAHYEM
ncbi:serine/threonine kinase [Fragilaria crotonensis]|nr:serine/threonine kinase [Fragilaria crotonensis]